MFYMLIRIIILVSLLLGGCVHTPPQDVITSPPGGAPYTFTADGQTITLIPGKNVAPEIYELAKTNPEFVANSDWVLIEGIWEPLAKGVVGPLEAEEPYPRDPTPTAAPGVPQGSLPYQDPLGRFSFTYPEGWTILPITSSAADGLWILNAPSKETSSRWISLSIYPNPDRASLPVWVAEHGGIWSGEVIEAGENVIQGAPVLAQLLVNENTQTGGPYTYQLLWSADTDRVYLWTAWPGEQIETLNVLERVMYSFVSGAGR